MEEALANEPDAASLWIETALDEGMTVPAASDLKAVTENLEYAGCVFAVVNVDLSKLSDKTERINITLPSRALRHLDFLAQKSGETRSGFLADLIYSA